MKSEDFKAAESKGKFMFRVPEKTLETYQNDDSENGVFERHYE
jgi:hypothetical protein